MRKLILLLLALRLLSASVSVLPAKSPEETPPAVAAAEKGDDLLAVLARIAQEYDPAAGTVGAIRWAEKLLSAWERSGEDAEEARAAAEALGAEALESRLPKLRWAAEKLASGADLGLMNEPGHKSDWTGADVESLFAALYDGAGLSETQNP